jgi:hypothetical protein
MKLWNHHDRKAAQELVSWLLSTMKDSRGWGVDWVNMVALDELPALSSQPDITSHLVNQTLREMKLRSKRTLADFEELFEVALKANRAALRNQSKDPYRRYRTSNSTIAFEK